MSQSLLGWDSKGLYAISSIALKKNVALESHFFLSVFSYKISFNKRITYGLFYFDKP